MVLKLKLTFVCLYFKLVLMSSNKSQSDAWKKAADLLDALYGAADKPASDSLDLSDAPDSAAQQLADLYKRRFTPDEILRTDPELYHRMKQELIKSSKLYGSTKGRKNEE